ncbi:MAG: RNA polymerase subunit sigma [Marinilabiliales bacterium]|nr:MAG: RNA polymerase subunit sigma [Marinilabiliales bacterium]
MESISRAVELIKNSKHCIAFTGAGISVESGIPPFRGETGLWSKYDPIILDLNYFKSNPYESWTVIKEIFYDFFGAAKPNAAHKGLAKLEEAGILKSVITQNIDNLHQEAGSKTVYEFHGNSHSLECTECNGIYKISELDFDNLPVLCPRCEGLIKPGFIFFGEGIPHFAYEKSVEEAYKTDVMILIGTTGEIVPASYIPRMAKENNAKIIELNVERSLFTDTITDIFIQEKASVSMNSIINKLDL